jgi:hypothetical protein
MAIHVVFFFSALSPGPGVHVQLRAGRQAGVDMKIAIENFQHRFSPLETIRMKRRLRIARKGVYECQLSDVRRL